MKMAPYAYTVVAYVHDPVAGERLNCALLFYAPEDKLLRCITSKHPQRLEQAFGRFVRQQHERVLSDIGLRTEAVREQFDAEQGPWKAVDRFDEIVSTVLRDQGVSYQASPSRFGLTADPIEEAEELFARFVECQRPVEVVESREPRQRHRGDGAVWRSFKNVVRQREALRDALKPVTLRAAGMEIAFDHAAKNGKYHVVQPISFDVISASKVAEKVAGCVGMGMALKDAEDLAQIFFLLGKPSAPELQDDFQNAVEFLNRGVPVKHEIVYEDQVEHLANELEKVLSHT